MQVTHNSLSKHPLINRVRADQGNGNKVQLLAFICWSERNSHPNIVSYRIIGLRSLVKPNTRRERERKRERGRRINWPKALNYEYIRTVTTFNNMAWHGILHQKWISVFLNSTIVYYLKIEVQCKKGLHFH